jgi:uncharacterized protein YbjT (DUF2867 family)
MTKVLVTGAVGYVGKRLILSLLNQGFEVYALCYIEGTRLFEDEKKGLNLIWGDLRNPHTLENLPHDIEAAYYLVHSMSEVANHHFDTDIETAKAFLEALKKTQTKQVIYLSSIINDENTDCHVFKARMHVEKTLRDSSIPVTIIRTGVVIGSGSAAFEIIRDLVEKMSVIPVPSWAENPCQPISIRDVLFYLTGTLLKQQFYNNIYDIGGPDVLSFKKLMQDYADYRKFKRVIFTLKFLPKSFSSYWFVFISSVNYAICRYFFEVLSHTSIKKLGNIDALLPHKNLTYKESLDLIFQKIAQNEVVSTWMDSWDIQSHDPTINNFIEVPQDGCLKDIQNFYVADSKEEALKRIWSIGGDTGYYAMDWAWYLRGLFDQLIGGVGLNRGRRHPNEIVPGDSIDFWRVIKADKKTGHLILWATMKVPGDAWLEFRLNEKEGKWLLTQTATFRPNGIWGRTYWWSMYPFHLIIFAKMAKTIAGIIK